MMTYAEQADRHMFRCEWQAAADAWGKAIADVEPGSQAAILMEAQKAACEYAAKDSREPSEAEQGLIPIPQGYQEA